MSRVNILSQLTLNQDLNITYLRKDILDIFLNSKKPLSAYEVLDKLRKKRPKAEPPTVYRAINYFVEKKLIHRIEAENKYISCSQIHNHKIDHHGVLFFCKKCSMSTEFLDDAIFKAIKKFSENHKLFTNESIIEIKGICEDCLKKAK